MAKLRQEINLIDTTLVGQSAGAFGVAGKALLDTTQYNGTVTYYIEVLAKNTSATNDCTFLLVGGAGVSVTIPANTSSFTLFRQSFTPAAGQTEFYASNSSIFSASSTLTTKSARIVIIQEATTLTNTETQIEIGNYNTGRTTESAAILTNPKYWKYDASKWDGTKTFYAEAVYDSGSMDTVTIGIYESAAIDAPSWSLNATIVSAAETTTPTRTRVAFTPVDGRWYTIFSLNGSMDNHDVYSAKIVVQQVAIIDSYPISNVDNFNSYYNGSFDWAGQTFIGNGDKISAAEFYLKTPNSPTGTMYAKVYAHTGTFGTNGVPTGSPLDTSAGVNVNTLTSSYQLIRFNFSGGVTLSNGTNYVIVLDFQTGTVGNASNVVHLGIDFTSSVDSGNAVIGTTGSSWLSDNSYDVVYYVYGGLTKLEPQYLLANTLLAAGTALQDFESTYDSTEWSGVTNTYTLQAEAANGSTSDVELWKADGSGSALGTVTNIDNAGTGSVTFP